VRATLHQAGVIAYRVVRGQIHVLLITSRDTGRWIIPKGNIDAGKTPAKAAERTKRGRPTHGAAGDHAPFETISGDRGLDHEEPLLFEIGRLGKCGVDLPETELKHDRLGGLRRRGAIGLPGLSEPEIVRHFVRLSRKNYAIDAGLYPLGSCTMKHNPRLNEKMARLPGFADIHPLQPVSTVQGALESYQPVLEGLSRAHRVIAYDRRFGGQSKSPIVVQTWDQVCQDVVGLMDVLGIDQAFLGGGSFGAAISLGCAARYPVWRLLT
jgi:hypothetical protein